MATSDNLGFRCRVETSRKEGSQEWGAKARGRVILGDPENPDEVLTIPVAVARRLKARLASDEIHVGSRAELLYHIRHTAESCCSFKAETLLNKRDYTSSDLASKLLSDGYSTQLVESVVERLGRVGVVDDARYAEGYVNAKIAAGWGERKIAFELKKRGVEVADIEGWPERFFSRDDEFERALLLAQRKRFSTGDVYAKAVRFLCGRGFSMDVASRVARRIKEEALGE